MPARLFHGRVGVQMDECVQRLQHRVDRERAAGLDRQIVVARQAPVEVDGADGQIVDVGVGEATAAGGEPGQRVHIVAGIRQDHAARERLDVQLRDRQGRRLADGVGVDQRQGVEARVPSDGTADDDAATIHGGHVGKGAELHNAGGHIAELGIVDAEHARAVSAAEIDELAGAGEGLQREPAHARVERRRHIDGVGGDGEVAAECRQVRQHGAGVSAERQGGAAGRQRVGRVRKRGRAGVSREGDGVADPRLQRQRAPQVGERDGVRRLDADVGGGIDGGQGARRYAAGRWAAVDSRDRPVRRAQKGIQGARPRRARNDRNDGRRRDPIFQRLQRRLIAVARHPHRPCCFRE